MKKLILVAGVILLMTLFITKEAACDLRVYFDFKDVSLTYITFSNEFNSIFLELYKAGKKEIRGNHIVSVLEIKKLDSERQIEERVIVIFLNKEQDPIWERKTIEISLEIRKFAAEAARCVFSCLARPKKLVKNI